MGQKPFSILTNSSTAGYGFPSTLDYLISRGHLPELILSPEHGIHFEYQAGEKVQSGLHNKIPVQSLYTPDSNPWKPIRLKKGPLLFDLKTTGTRCFTYVAFLKMAFLSAQFSKKPLWVIDRENHLPPYLEGPFPQFSKKTLLCPAPLPFLSPFSTGNLALWFKETQYPEVDLRVIKAPLFPFSPPSPNLPTIQAVHTYPITVFFEGTTLSEGRGTLSPFEWFGSPTFPNQKFCLNSGEKLQKYFQFSPENTTPTFSKWALKKCQGVKIKLTQEGQSHPFLSFLKLFSELIANYRSEFEWVGLQKPSVFFDRLLGGKEIRLALESKKEPEEIMDSLTSKLEVFREKFQSYFPFGEKKIES